MQRSYRYDIPSSIFDFNHTENSYATCVLELWYYLVKQVNGVNTVGKLEDVPLAVHCWTSDSWRQVQLDISIDYLTDTRLDRDRSGNPSHVNQLCRGRVSIIFA